MNIKTISTYISIDALMDSTAPEDQVRKEAILGIIDGTIDAAFEPMTMNYVETIDDDKVRFQAVVGPTKGSSEYTNWHGKRNTWQFAMPLLRALQDLTSSGIGKALHIAVALTNEGGKNFRVPLFLVETRDIKDLNHCTSFSIQNLIGSQGQDRKNDPKKYLEFATERNRAWLNRTGFDNELFPARPVTEVTSSSEVQEPLLNEKNGMVDIGRMVGGSLCSYWVPLPEFIRLAPNVLVSKELLKAGSR